MHFCFAGSGAVSPSARLFVAAPWQGAAGSGHRASIRLAHASTQAGGAKSALKRKLKKTELRVVRDI